LLNIILMIALVFPSGNRHILEFIWKYCASCFTFWNSKTWIC